MDELPPLPDCPSGGECLEGCGPDRVNCIDIMYAHELALEEDCRRALEYLAQDVYEVWQSQPEGWNYCSEHDKYIPCRACPQLEDLEEDS